MQYVHLRRFPRVEGDFPVEFVAEGQTIKAHATILGGGGLLLRTGHAMQIGETLTVNIRPAKTLHRIEVRAIVRSVSPTDGVGVEFTSLRPEDHQKILRFIHARLDEKRKDTRAPFVAQVHHQHSTFLGLSKNISVGGMFVVTKETIPVNAPLELRFHLDDGDPVIVAQCKVTYVIDGVGLGICFVDLDEADEERIRDYVAKGTAEPALSASAMAG